MKQLESHETTKHNLILEVYVYLFPKMMAQPMTLKFIFITCNLSITLQLYT